MENKDTNSTNPFLHAAKDFDISILNKVDLTVEDIESIKSLPSINDLNSVESLADIVKSDEYQYVRKHISKLTCLPQYSNEVDCWSRMYAKIHYRRMQLWTNERYVFSMATFRFHESIVMYLIDQVPEARDKILEFVQ